jgi:hypothetical protein
MSLRQEKIVVGAAFCGDVRGPVSASRSFRRSDA